MSGVRIIVLATVVIVSGCAAPTLTNTTPTSIARSPVPLYPLSARVDDHGNQIVHVRALVNGNPWDLMASTTDEQNYRAGYFAELCETNIPYHFSVGYKRKNWIGPGYSNTVREKRFPLASGYVLTVTGEPPPSDCAAPIGETFSVNSIADEVDAEPGNGLCETLSGRCTLRAAVMESNASQGHDLITIAPGHYVLSLTGSEAIDAPDDAINDLDITDGTTLTGSRYAARNEDLSVFIDGGGIDRVFDIYSRAPQFVTLTYLRLENGRPVGSGGGAIWNRGNLRMDRMMLRNNRLDDSFDSSCAADASRRICNRGAGFFNEGKALLSRSTIESNDTGGISGHGGGISNMGPAAELYIRASLLTNNDARFYGGLVNYQGLIDIENSTFTDNTVNTGGVVAVEIGNLGGGTATIRNSTFSNSSQIFVHSGTGRFQLANSLVYMNRHTSRRFCAGPISSGGFNVIAGPSDLTDYLRGCGFIPTTADITEERVSLGALRHHGGPTRTIQLREPLPDSPFFEPIDVGGVLCPDTDQRGYPRDDGRCDTGAYER